MRQTLRKRITFLFCCILAGALFLVVRLYFVQIVHGDDYRDRAERQYARPNERMYDRGSISFEDKDGRIVSAATLATGFILAVDPSKIEDGEKTYAALSKIVPLEKGVFLKKIGKKEDPYEELAHRLTKGQADSIEALEIEGVSLYREKWRYYPAERTAARTIGFVGFAEDGTSKTGLYGLERSYDDVLSRSHSLDVNFFAELFASVGESLASNRRGEGDVVTSIEPNVSIHLEKSLASIHDKYSSKQTGGIIMDPKTGEIYAISVLPNFNLNEFDEEKSGVVFQNPIVGDVREMGSIIKPLTVAAGLDSGAIKPETTYYDAGFLELDGYTIHNFDGKGRGTVPMQEVLSQSLNTGVSFIVQKMGTKKFAEYFKKFGLGEETGIDLPGEAHGIIDNLDSPRKIEYATASFGQGIAMTPIATVRALSALASGGVLPTPHVAKRIVYTTGYTKDVSFPEGERVISEKASEEISRMLVSVVDEALMHGKIKLDHYSVAAKTGTAQIAKETGRGYYDDRYLHSFFGYFPAYEPRFIIFLYTIEPEGVQYASETLTMPFHELTKFLISYYAIPPDR